MEMAKGCMGIGGDECLGLVHPKGQVVQGKKHAKELCICNGMQGAQFCHKPHLLKSTPSIIKEGQGAVRPLEDGAICEGQYSISS